MGGGSVVSAQPYAPLVYRLLHTAAATRHDQANEGFLPLEVIALAADPSRWDTSEAAALLTDPAKSPTLLKLLRLYVDSLSPVAALDDELYVVEVGSTDDDDVAAAVDAFKDHVAALKASCSSSLSTGYAINADNAGLTDLSFLAVLAAADPGNSKTQLRNISATGNGVTALDAVALAPHTSLSHLQLGGSPCWTGSCVSDLVRV